MSQFLQGRVTYAKIPHCIAVQGEQSSEIVEISDDFFANKYAVCRKMSDILAICAKFGIPSAKFETLGSSNGYVMMFVGNKFLSIIDTHCLICNSNIGIGGIDQHQHETIKNARESMSPAIDFYKHPYAGTLTTKSGVTLINQVIGSQYFI